MVVAAADTSDELAGTSDAVWCATVVNFRTKSD